MKKLGYILWIYAAAVVLILCAGIFYEQALLSHILLTVGALALDTAVVLNFIQRIRDKAPMFGWSLGAICAALAFTLAAVIDWTTYFS